jgi:hypothetical protein
MMIYAIYETATDHELACQSDPTVAAVSMEVAAATLGITTAAVEDMIWADSLPTIKIADNFYVPSVILAQIDLDLIEEGNRKAAASKEALFKEAEVTVTINYESLLAALAPLADYEHDPEIMGKVIELILPYADLHFGHRSPKPFSQSEPLFDFLPKAATDNNQLEAKAI